MAEGPFPDIEAVFLDLLDGLAETVTATGPTITPPLIRIVRIGGADDGVTDRPRVQLVHYGHTRRDAWALARQTQQVVLAAAGSIVTGPETVEEYPGGVLLDVTATATPPRQLDEQGRDERSVETIYEVHLRRPWW